MKRYLYTIVAFMAALSVCAVPALRQRRSIRLTDGSSIEATFCGNEYQHYYLDAQGNAYQQGADGLFQLADKQMIMEHAAQRILQRNTRRMARAKQRMAVPGAVPQQDFTGQKNCLVVLAGFSDCPMTYSAEDYNRYFNEIGYNEYGMKGSVRDYFLACSYGQLDIHFDIVGPIKLKKSVTYYGSNDSRGDDRHPGQMVSEAIIAAKELGTDFSKYDWDNDGEVDQVYVIYAGYGEAQSGIETNIWPHENSLSATGDYGDGPGALTYDGVTIDTYATSCELGGKRGEEIDGIGTACHEFSHCMGLPDTYDALQTGNFAMDVWDIMDYGCYNGVGGKMGSCPWEFTSYERIACGWLTPIELKEGCEVKDMKPLNEAPEAYIIYNEGNRNEYYLLENRQLKGFDAGGYGHGMLVLRVDYDEKAWSMNMVNTDKARQRMTIIPADNVYNSLAGGIANVAGDPFPGTKKKTQLTDNSFPKATLNTPNSDGIKLMHKPITQIKETLSDGYISFLFMGGGPIVDTFQAPTEQAFSLPIHDLQGRPAMNALHGPIIKNGKMYMR